MDKREAIKIVRQYKKAISASFSPVKVYLYGSYSKDCADAESDIDVAVVVPKMKGDWFSVVPLLWKAGRSVNILIEPVLLEECNPSPLYDEVMRTGIAI